MDQESLTKKVGEFVTRLIDDFIIKLRMYVVQKLQVALAGQVAGQDFIQITAE